MRKNSLIEDIFEIASKSPVAGLILSILFACVGLYLNHKVAPVGAKPADMVFLPLYHFFGGVLYMLSFVVLFISGIGYIVTYSKRKRQTAFFGSRRTLDDIKNLSWKEFEEFVGSIFRKMGYSVEVTGGLDDGGIDLIIKKDGRTSLVQCKNYRVSKVSLSMVRDFYGAMNASLNFEAGYFITTGMFTLEARHFADDKPIELIDGAKLMDYVEMTSGREEPGEKKALSSTRRPKAPLCPKCGADMILRTTKRGDKAGSQFWGCSTYPKCRGTRVVSSASHTDTEKISNVVS